MISTEDVDYILGKIELQAVELALVEELERVIPNPAIVETGVWTIDEQA